MSSRLCVTLFRNVLLVILLTPAYCHLNSNPTALETTAGNLDPLFSIFHALPSSMAPCRTVLVDLHAANAPIVAP